MRCLAVLLIAAIHGAIYILLVPPWSHYDEPTHFEYAWLIANRLRLPQQDDVDPGMRREVAASMLEHGFYRDLKFDPKVLIQAKPIWLGVSELPHPPLYYILEAVPLRFLRYSDVRTQLYAGRVFSGLLYLSSIAIAFCLVAELVGRDHPLSWIVPATMALVPSYVDVMTSINNDVGAVVTMGLFLWGAVRFIQRGPTAGNIAWMVLAAVACVYTKNTAAVAAILLPIALLIGWAAPRGRRRTHWLAGAGLGAVLLLLPVIFSWGNAALWFHITPVASHTSQPVSQAPVGERALVLGVGGQAQQFLRTPDVQALQDDVVTLGAWMWSDQPATVRGLSLSDAQSTSTAPDVELDTSPAFYTVTTTVSSEASYLIVSLDPRLTQDDLAQVVYYDGLVLVEGEPPPHTAPRFDGPRGEAGSWAGHPFVNRLRNGSAETTWPSVRPFVDRMLLKYAHRSPSRFLTSLLDWERSKELYRVAATILLQSFWARFGWNHIPLPPAWYWTLAVVTLVGLAGAVVAYLRLRTQSNVRRRAAVELLAVAALLVWANAFLRVHPIGTRIFIPVSRYAYPAIVPTMLALAGGWWSLPPRRLRPWAAAFMVCGLLVLDGVSIWTVAQFHNGV